MSAYAPQPTGVGTPPDLPDLPDLPDYTIGFADAVRRGFRKYVTFDGRASRAEFWYWYLFVVGVLLVLIVLTTAIGSATAGPDGTLGPVFVIGFVLAGIFYAAVLLPTIAVACRRLHDAGLSGLFLLLSLISGLIPLIMCALPTSPNAVRYGPPGQPDPYGLPPGAYAPAPGYDPQQGYAPAPGYDPQQGYVPQPGHQPQQGYAPHPGYQPQQGQEGQQGHAGPRAPQGYGQPHPQQSDQPQRD